MTDWNKRYKDENTGWDIGKPSPPLRSYIDHLKNKDLKILIPGAGNAYEAEHLFNKGFKNVYVLDIAKIALENLKKRCPRFPENQLIHGDFFSHDDSYDLILEQTFFCAIDPKLRVKYAQHMKILLSENGVLAGVMFNRTFENGPPYGGSKAEYLRLFGQYFNNVTMEECYNSIPPRLGSELFITISSKS